MIVWPDDWFEQFWKIYPRRVGKLAALKAAEKMRAAYMQGTPFEEFLNATKIFARSCQGKETQYIPHPSTWLNRGSWMDEYEQPKEEGAWKVNRAVEETLRRRTQ